MPVVYDQLRKIAARCLNSERPNHTLSATELVNEAYLRLVGSDLALHDRLHFYAIAARVLRNVLVDYARARSRQKRGAGAQQVTLDEALLITPNSGFGVLELDDALNRLSSNDARKGEIINLTVFGGLTQEEIAATLNISLATVQRELRMAKAWLHAQLAKPST